MHREVGRVTGVDAQGVDAEAGDAALDEELRGVDREPGERGAGVTEVAGRILPVRVPAGMDEHGGARFDRAVSRLELEDRRRADRGRRVAVDESPDVELDRRTDERPDRDRVDAGAVTGEVRRGIEVGAGVLGHLELAGVAAVGVVVGDGRGRERARAGPERGAGPERLCQVDETVRGEQRCEVGHTVEANDPVRSTRSLSAFGRAGRSDDALVEHRVRHLDEARDVGAVDVVAGGAVLLGGLPALAGGSSAMIAFSRASTSSRDQRSRSASCDISRPETATPPAFAALPGP